MVPAGKHVFFQVLDKAKKMIQSMRSGVSLMPGEINGCVGCHEDRLSIPMPIPKRPIALTKKPVELELYAKDAPKKLRAIADDPETPVKIRADIEKFFFEAVYGKAPQALDIEGKMENTGVQVVKFEGALEEWSE